MSRPSPDGCPQVAAIQPLSSNGSFILRKSVRSHLSVVPGDELILTFGDELWLAKVDGDSGLTARLTIGSHGEVTLPPQAHARLGSPCPERIALIERPDGLALKSIRVETVAGRHARCIDLETPASVIRRVETNPMPEVTIPALVAGLQDLRLPYDVADALKGRATLDAWAARRILGTPDPDDDDLRDQLVADRLMARTDEGTWGNGPYRLVRTARVLRELADLGVVGTTDAVQRAVAWLLARPQSEYNPGQWFLGDELVAQQAEIIAKRKAMTRGTRPRFRALRASETKQVMAGCDLIRAPCGPRIMWPTALVLDALLPLGYEQAPRVQTVLEWLLTEDWCECAYQHGTSDLREAHTFSGDRLDAYENSAVRRFRFAGLEDPADLYRRDLTHKPTRFLRVSCEKGEAADVYELAPDLHIQGCEFVTTRALAEVTNPSLRRFAEAHLWRFAGCQLADGTFPPERHGSGFAPLGILELFARYVHHPVAQVVLLRATPWLVAQQQDTGLWSQHGDRSSVKAGATTRAAVTVLKAVESHLPAAFWPAG